VRYGRSQGTPGQTIPPTNSEIPCSGIGSDRLGALVVLLLLQGGCWWEARPGPVPVIEAAKVPRIVLGSGTEETAQLRLLLRAGSAHEPVGSEGLACFLAQAQMSQAMDSDPDRWARLQEAGLKWQVEVDRELIRFEVDGAESALEDMSSLLGDAIMTGEIVDPHRHIEDSEPSGSLARSRFLDWLYAGHPYGHDSGCAQPLDGHFSAAQMQNFHADRYIRSSVRLVVELPGDPTGLSDPSKAAIENLSSRLGTLPPDLYEDVSPRMIPRPMEGRLVLADSAPGELWMGWASPVHPGHPDWAAMLLATEVLSLRLHPLELAATGRPPDWLDAQGMTPGWLGLPLIFGWTGVDAPQHLLDAVLPKLQDWTTGPFTEAELDRARDQLIVRMKQGMPLRKAQADLLNWGEAWGQLQGDMEPLTEADLTEVLARHTPMVDLRVLAGIEAGSEPDWILDEGSDEASVDAEAASSYDWKMGVPIRIDLQEP
jgi:predicted Zn-dependent peptidase